MGLAGNRDLLERPKIYCYDHGSNNIPTTISIHLKTGASFVLFFLGGNCSSSEQIAMLIAEPAGKARQRSSIAKEIW